MMQAFLPYQPSPDAGRDRTIDDPGMIGQEPGRDGLSGHLLDGGVQRAHPFLEDLMIVDPPRVAADAPARHAILRLAVVAAPVGDANGEDRQGIVHQCLRIARGRGAFGREPIHPGQMTSVDSVAQDCEDLGERFSARYRRDRQAMRESE